MSQLIYDELERAILTSQLKPRERLTETALAARFGTSRTSVREALERLELRELVVATRHRGATVRDFTSTELAKIYAVRAALVAPRAQDAQDALPQELEPEEVRREHGNRAPEPRHEPTRDRIPDRQGERDRQTDAFDWKACQPPTLLANFRMD